MNSPTRQLLYKRSTVCDILRRQINCLAGVMDPLYKFELFLLLTCLGKIGHGTDIINGQKVPANSMLYMASVQTDHGHECGGFLVSEGFVMTAAHCDNNQLSSVVLGTHDLNTVRQKISIEKKCKPKAYKDVGHGHDIMLLKLARKAQMDNSVQTVPLAESHINIKNAQCHVAGWGKTSTQGRGVNELRKVDVSIIDPQICKKQWPNLPDDVICAGGFGTNKGFCQGDSGGPLVCNGFAVGVVSFNRNKSCTYPDVPNVYTDITKHLYWIRSIIRQNNCY
ncbi:hypothetical protein Q5P01_016196 [Channa striata]|uniref:Peptidase S1 domain-containing protein n=1 Tax=Channa striata TaxID=64152 RepID=A0AA88MGK7_CHASR|nr:hypothetical protein Q5P01_016196 [Channa striata]